VKDVLRQWVDQQPNDFLRRSVVREYLQARILQSLQDHGAFMNWAFVGGTALRLLFGLPRYSEDLDFSLSASGLESRFSYLVRQVRLDFEAETYSVEVKARETGSVAAAFIKFRGLLHEMGISPHSDETLSVKVEIDTNPPEGAGLQTTVIRRFVTLHLLHHDRPSLFAGKLHAVLTRTYTKGRDIYDLIWYLADRSWPPPNLDMLNHALHQTGWKGPEATEGNWRALVLDRMERVDWRRAVQDVSPFLERKQDVALLTLENVRSLLTSA